MARRISASKIKLGACAYDWRTKQPTKYHPDPILDSEDFCRRILDRAFDSWGMHLRDEDFNDTLSELIALVWKLEKQFDPDKASSFSAYAAWIVSQRAVDYGPRRILGRHGTRTHNTVAQNFDEDDQVGESIDRLALDDQDDRSTDVEGLLRERSGEILRKTLELGIRSDGLFEEGD